MMAANCGMPAAEMTELFRKIRPKSSSSGKISQRDRAGERCVRAQPVAQACAGAPGRLCHRLRATVLLPREFCHSDRAAFRAWQFVTTCDGRLIRRVRYFKHRCRVRPATNCDVRLVRVRIGMITGVAADAA